MNLLSGIRRFFFQKATSDFDANEALRRNQTRYNALYALDPDVLVRHLAAFQRGDICGLERVIDEFETREDKMRIGSFKMAAAVASKPWTVRIRQGEEENPRAKLHQEHLTRFWNRVEATDAFCRNRRGGLRLLVKQMMSAQSRVYSVHDICWKVNADGSLSATFTHVPAWCFENRTGRLRYIKNDCDTAGVEMPDGEWLVTVGEGVGIAAAVIAMAKRLSWNDWLLFSEKCGMPVILGNTNAQRGTDAWNAMARAIRAIAPKTGLLADTGTTLNAVSMGAGSQQTYRELVDSVDRAISALYRGGDLATQSSNPDAAGVNAQAGESELMDDDGCKMIAETLRDQVEKFVIRFELGDFEPLAEIVINPPADTDDVEREMAIDNHLANLGVKLSRKDALQRYGRTEAEDDDDALHPPQTPPQGPSAALANETPAQTPLQTSEKPLQNAGKGKDGQSPVPDETALKSQKNGVSGKGQGSRAKGQGRDALVAPTLETEIASIIAETFADEIAKGGTRLSRPDEAATDLPNSVDANGMEHGEHDGRFVSKGEGGANGAMLGEQLAKLGYEDKADLELQAQFVMGQRVREITSGELKAHCKAHEAIAVLNTEPKIKNAFGKDVTFGKDMILHYLSGRGRENNAPDVERLRELPLAIHAVRHDHNPTLQYPRGVAHDPVNPPRGTQYVYSEKVGNGNMQCRAWVDSGKVKGWFVK